MCGQSAKCEVVYTWILDRVREGLVAVAWKTRRLLGGLVTQVEIFLGCFYQSVDLE